MQRWRLASSADGTRSNRSTQDTHRASALLMSVGCIAKRHCSLRSWLASARSAPGPSARRMKQKGRFPSGQRGQTVNLLVPPSQVRILLSPPSALFGLRLLALPGFLFVPVGCSPPQKMTAMCGGGGMQGQPGPCLCSCHSLLVSGFARVLCSDTTLHMLCGITCGCSSMVERQPSKLYTRVRFPSPAPPPPPRLRRFALRLEVASRSLNHRCFVSVLFGLVGGGFASCCSSVVEHFLGKEEVSGSSPDSSSIQQNLD